MDVWGVSHSRTAGFSSPGPKWYATGPAEGMTMAMAFKKAERKRAKLRLALSGPSGSGKTYSALLVAKGMGGRVAVIDTEQGSASLYSHVAEFDALELSPPYTPERYIEAIHAAVAGGYEVLVIDSMTHEWDGAGGCLELNEKMAHSKFKGNTWAAWNETTPRHRAFVDAILQAPIHVIATMRSKTETVQGEGKKVVKLGMKTVQRDGTDYEFTTVLDLTHDNHYATASKDRTGLFSQPELLGEATGRKLLDWLNSGVEFKAEPKKAEGPATVKGMYDALAKKAGPTNAGDLLSRVQWIDAQLTRLVDDHGIGDTLAAVCEFSRVDSLGEVEAEHVGAAWRKALGCVANCIAEESRK